MQLIEHGILPNSFTTPTNTFLGEDISRAQRAYRLQRDFDASFSAVAMMLDLINTQDPGTPRGQTFALQVNPFHVLSICIFQCRSEHIYI